MKQVQHELGKGECADGNSQDDEQQEDYVRFLCPLFELTLEEQFCCPDVEGLKGVDQSFEDSGQERNGSAAYAWDDVGGSDADSLEGPQCIFSDFAHVFLYAV